MHQKASNSYALFVGQEDQARLDVLDEIYGSESRAFVDSRVLAHHAVRVVADVGCGHGHMLRHIARHAPKAEVIGIDISDAQLQQTQKHASASGLRNVRTLSASNISSIKCQVDFVYSRFVLMHQSDRAAYIQSLIGLSAPRALAVFEEPCLRNTVTYPYSKAVHLANELTLALGMAKGINYDVSDGIFDSLADSYEVLDAEVSQPMLRSPRQKSIIPRSFDQISDELVSRNIVSRNRADRISQELWDFSANSECFCTGLRIFRVLATVHPLMPQGQSNCSL